MDKIIDKLKKLLALAERGEAGEARNARRILETELRKHGLTLEDLSSEVRKERIFPYKDTDERAIFIQVLVNVCGSKSEAFKSAGYNTKRKRLYVDLTDLEYVEILEKFEFFRRQYNKEKKRLLNDLAVAFLSKHRLYDKDPNEEKDSNPLSPEDIRRILKLGETLDDVHFYKALSQ